MSIWMSRLDELVSLGFGARFAWGFFLGVAHVHNSDVLTHRHQLSGRGYTCSYSASRPT